MNFKTVIQTDYRCGSRQYLKRAQEQTQNGDPAALFYAALELRCGIESRMQEYLSIAEDISEKRKRGWKIVSLGNDIQKAFKLGDKIVELSIHLPAGQSVKIYHTPVRSKLRQQAQRLGDYLHAMKVYRKANDPWWNSFRSFLNETCCGLEFATTGTLLGPPLLRPGAKTFELHHELEVNPSVDELVALMGRAKENIVMGVDYLDILPT